MPEAFKWSGENLNWPELEAWIRGAAAEIAVRHRPPRPALLPHVVCRKIVTHFLGHEWFAENASEKAGDGYFAPDFDPAQGGRAAVYTSKLNTLAECLFHLQYVPNASGPIVKLATDLGNIESYVAELLVGMMLFQDAIYFRYLETDGAQGVKTPDIEIEVGGVRAFADVKCKYDLRDYTPGCLKSAFESARRQIGSGNQGIIFIKAPQKWAADDGNTLELPKELVDESREYMRRTSRVVRAIYYIYHLNHKPGVGIENRHGIGELAKPNLAPDSIWRRPLFPYRAGNGWLRIPDLIERALHGFPQPTSATGATRTPT